MQVLTLYAFSTENWRRPDTEVRGLMSILAEVIDRETRELHKNGVRLRHIGELAALPPSLRERVERAVGMTRENSPLDAQCRVQLRWALRDRSSGTAHHRVGVAPGDVTEDLIGEHLDTAGLPDPTNHTHGWRDAAEQLSSVAGRVCRILVHTDLLAGVRPR